MRRADTPTIEVVINRWCPDREIELVDAVVISRPTRTIDADILSAFAQIDPEMYDPTTGV